MPSKAKSPKASHNSTVAKDAFESNQWDAILNSLSDPISVHSATGEIVWANKRLCEVYSITLSELLGLSCEQAFPNESAGAVDDQDRGGPQTEYEVAVRERLWSVTIRPLSADGKALGFVRHMHDVTEQRRARRQLLDAERFASLGQMLFGIAHNIGTPLNIISGYSEFLLMRTKPDDQGHKELSAILDQTKRITLLLSEALDVVRSGQRPASPIDIKDLLADVLNLAAHYFRKTGVSVQLTCATRSPLIYGGAPQMRQAFFSLMLNASQSVGIGGRLEVVIGESHQMPGGLSVSLWGTEGNGQAHDFSPSFQSFVDGGNELVSTGFGLSLARQALDAAGAMLAFGGAENRGVPIVVHLPVRQS
ncbi:MAG TPA: PAS domain-containing protein [Blastocatellia bacterium]|nr:PAS domain-containing protein [Blastocatellia bacterium]